MMATSACRYFVHVGDNTKYVMVPAAGRSYIVLKDGTKMRFRTPIERALRAVRKGEWKEISQEEAERL